MKKIKFTEKEVERIMKLYRDGVDARIIAKEFKTSQSFISNFARAFNGNEHKMNTLSKDSQNLIRKLSPFYKSIDVINQKHSVQIVRKVGLIRRLIEWIY